MVSKNLKALFCFFAFFYLKTNPQEKVKDSFSKKIFTSVFGLITNGYLAAKSTSQESKKVACIGIIQNIKEIVEAVSENFFQKETELNLEETKRYKNVLKRNFSKMEKISIKIIRSLLKNKNFINIFNEISLKNIKFSQTEESRYFFDLIIPKTVQLDQEDI